MAFRWRANDGQILNASLVTVIFQGIRTSMIPYIKVIFQGEGGPDPRPPPPTGSVHDTE